MQRGIHRRTIFTEEKCTMTYNVFDIHGVFQFALSCAKIAETSRYDYAVGVGRQVLGDQFLCVELS
jgi:hypothetical protein